MHGSAPDTHPSCLLLIDLISDFEFPRGDELLYLNDNFGRWRSDRSEIIGWALRPDSRVRPSSEIDIAFLANGGEQVS